MLQNRLLPVFLSSALAAYALDMLYRPVFGPDNHWLQETFATGLVGFATDLKDASKNKLKNI